MTQEEVLIYSQENLNKELKKVITKYFKNKELIKSINFELAEKNMNSNITSALFLDGTLEPKDLSKEEKMAITKVCYDVLKLEKLNYRKYYEAEERGDYNSYKNIEKQIKEIELHKIQKIDEYNYIGRISYEQIYLYMKNVLFRYNKLAQRAFKTKSYGTKDSSIRVIDLKQKNVNAMLELILKGKLESTQIIINVRLPEGDEDFEPKYVFESIDEENLPDIGTLSIYPLYDIDSKDFTVAEILDGFHRLVAVYQAIAQYKAENNGTVLEGGLDIRIVMRTLSEAQEIVRQIFERSDTNKEFIKGFKQGDDVDFLKLVEDNSKILKGEIAINFEEHKMSKTLTYKTILLDALKLTEIQVEKKGSIRTIAKELGSTIDELVESLKFKYFNDNLEDMEADSMLLSCNMFVGYLAIANTMRTMKDYNKIDEVIDNLYTVPKSQLEKLKINRSPNSCNYKVIYKYFTNLVMEVYKVA
jgi:hypothetical protein